MMTWNAWYEIQLALGGIFLPLSLEAAVRLTRRPGWRQAAILGVVLGAALLVDQESTILAWSLAAAVLLLWLARRPARGGAAAGVKLRLVALAGVVTAVVASPPIIAMVQQALAGQATVSQGALADDYRNSGAALERIFAPSPRVAFFGLKSVASVYYHAAPTSFTFTAYGVVLTALGLLGLVVGWRRRNVRLLALLWLAGTWLALGTGIVIGNHRYVPLAQVWHGVRLSGIMPYTWMVRISLLSSFREADRITEIGLVAAALLAGAAVNWLRYHARPALVVVAALAILEAGSVGVQPFQATIPTALPALDRPIAADHSRSIVVDVPMGVRSAVPLPDEGAAFNSEAEMQAPADGHPRAIAYISRLPESTLAAVKLHPLYAACSVPSGTAPPISSVLSGPGAWRTQAARLGAAASMWAGLSSGPPGDAPQAVGLGALPGRRRVRPPPAAARHRAVRSAARLRLAGKSPTWQNSGYERNTQAVLTASAGCAPAQAAPEATLEQLAEHGDLGQHPSGWVGTGGPPWSCCSSRRRTGFPGRTRRRPATGIADLPAPGAARQRHWLPPPARGANVFKLIRR
jgi:hypothetical protein